MEMGDTCFGNGKELKFSIKMMDGIINMKTHMLIIINLLATLMFVASCKQDAEGSFSLR